MQIETNSWRLNSVYLKSNFLIWNETKIHAQIKEQAKLQFIVFQSLSL